MLQSKQNAELELADVQSQLDEVMRNKADAEDKLFRLSREKADVTGQLEDNEEELADVMKKYKVAVAQLSVDQITISEQANNITDLEEERNRLKENLAEFAQKVQSLEGENVSTAQHHRLELKIKELESKLDLEQTTRGRMESQINRLKEGIEKLTRDCDSARNKEQSSQDLVSALCCLFMNRLKRDYSLLGSQITKATERRQRGFGQFESERNRFVVEEERIGEAIGALRSRNRHGQKWP